MYAHPGGFGAWTGDWLPAQPEVYSWPGQQFATGIAVGAEGISLDEAFQPEFAECQVGMPDVPSSASLFNSVVSRGPNSDRIEVVGEFLPEVGVAKTDGRDRSALGQVMQRAT